MTQDFVQALPVHVAADITVVSGANLGDAISFADELDLDDVYELRPVAAAQRLTLAPGTGGALVVAPGSTLGRAGHAVHLDATLTMMTATGTTTELLVLVEVDGASDVEAIYALPLSQLTPRTDYTLVGIDRSNARARFAEVACVSFARGTHVTMASGAQVMIEDLTVGDMVLTRDDGPRPLRWIGSNTVRAVGDFAPVRIRAGALNNENDLTVSPESRLFIYQRSDALGAGRAEVMVRARHLVNGDAIAQQHGGFVEYFQLLFDDHQIIYAEGIATETMLVDPRTRTVLPPDLIEALSQRPPDHARRVYMDLEVQQGLVTRPDVAAILRHASKR
ncbi:Hint domain-containing protein [Roseovarius sp. M141]|uniref:Hint domain-containing protein n=1 Tax=Roseovarius sp. M141 TaxID=2583806 RepID=UPI0020CE0BAE|nr:Hint domain-containing protein [Roseovarius sp. M141]MCQ0092945.1 Hint domain-containing protein [Roseovarius sp. M141]